VRHLICSRLKFQRRVRVRCWDRLRICDVNSACISSFTSLRDHAEEKVKSETEELAMGL